MEENCMHCSTALGYKKDFYKKLTNTGDQEIKNFDCENANLLLLYEADKPNFDLQQTSAPQKHEKLHDRYL
uniref:Protein Churchill n=1 Tax=Romanomermis culicivorax TaxID=13658 RepID=A0A915HNA4_ROMCU